MPGGGGGESSQAAQRVHVKDDSDPGLPAATGSVAAGGPPTDDEQEGGPITDAIRDQDGEGQGSARFPEGSDGSSG